MTVHSAMADAHLESLPHVLRSQQAAALAAETAAAVQKAEQSEAAWIRCASVVLWCWMNRYKNRYIGCQQVYSTAYASEQLGG